MDCYKILRVSEDASSEEIYKSYIALKSNYSESYNTSPYAKRKYREIEKAYQKIKDKLSRELYQQFNQVEKKIYNEELFDYDSYRNNDDKEVYVSLPLLDKESVNSIDVTRVIKEKEKNIDINVEYLYYALSIKYDFSFNKKEKCNHALTTESLCDCCNGIGKVNYEDDVIKCPVCYGNCYVKIHNCEYCNNRGYVNKIAHEQIYIDKKLLSEGIVKDNVKYNFNLINEDIVREEKNNIYVNYDLSYQESVDGINIRWDTSYGSIMLKEEASKIKKEYVFDLDKKVHLLINKIPYKGTNIHKYLFVKISDLNKKIYLDINTLNYSLNKVSNYNVELLLTGDEDIVLSTYGNDGINNGEKGDLILSPILTNSNIKNIDMSEYKVEKVKTSLYSNLFGGKFNGGYNFGFKGKNSIKIDDKNKKLYLLTGDAKEKRRVSSYPLLSIFIYTLWLMMPLLLFVLPYTKMDLIVSCVLTIIYSIGANVILNIKI